MSQIAIRSDKLSKQYRLGARKGGYRTLRESIGDWARLPARFMRRLFGHAAPAHETMWALRDVSFEIPRGEVVGVIGPNGAGKSTLLKILSRITEPTSGQAEIHGRVGSLLEVGTGFHPELSGRENVYLSGAILGMSRQRIMASFDQIVDFAGVEQFIDTPVKHYSSGMYLRLAFAVAAHLDPEILLVDEVLAVGDLAFQKKCLGRMGEVAKDGRTILFVSHNMAAIRSLCTKGMFLRHGELEVTGNVSQCIERYYQSLGVLKGEHGGDGAPPAHGGFGRLSLPGTDGATIQQGESFEAESSLLLPAAVQGMSLFCILEDMHGRHVFHLREESNQLGIDGFSPGVHRIRLRIPPLWLNPGVYSLYLKAIPWQQGKSTRWVSDVLPLDVAGENSKTDSLLHPKVQWNIGPAESEAASPAPDAIAPTLSQEQESLQDSSA